MPITISDVAKAAGVSLATVSRALADSPRVKPETRHAIHKLAREMGYAPSAIARGLATKRTHTLGVVVRDIADAFVAEFVRAIDPAAQDRGYTLLLAHCGDDPLREPTAIKMLLQHRVDGIVVADPSVDDAVLPTLDEYGVPVILVNRPSYAHSVGTDNVLSAKLAVGHLLDQGHRRIAYVGSVRNQAESAERQSGYEQALASRGLAPDPALVASCSGHWAHIGRECTARLLQLAEPPTALFCFNDLTAIGALSALQAAGLRVPRDISLVGFDDITLVRYLEPPLTTIAQDNERLAELSLEMLAGLLAGQDCPDGQLVPGRLILRASTAQPRR